MLTLPFFKNDAAKNNARGNSSMIDMRDVHKYYQSAAGDYHALKGIDLQINPAEFVSIIGKSGSGKSTLLNMIAGIDRPTTGEVWVNGTGVHGLDENQMAIWRGDNLGIIFQFFQLLPALSLLQNVILPMELAGKYKIRERRERAEHLLEIVGLADAHEQKPGPVALGIEQGGLVLLPGEISGPIAALEGPATLTIEGAERVGPGGLGNDNDEKRSAVSFRGGGDDLGLEGHEGPGEQRSGGYGLSAISYWLLAIGQQH